MPNILYDIHPRRIQLPPGIAEFEVEKAARRDGDDPRLAVNLHLRVVAPTEFNGEVTEGGIQYHTFYLGTDDDPEGELEETQLKMYGWRDLVNFFRAVHLDAEPDLDRQLPNTIGLRVLALLKVEPKYNDPSVSYTNVKQWFPLGSKVPRWDGIFPNGSVPKSPAQFASASGPKKPAGMAAVRGKKRNNYDDDEIPF